MNKGGVEEGEEERDGESMNMNKPIPLLSLLM